jgi:hypothetical protein
VSGAAGGFAVQQITVRDTPQDTQVELAIPGGSQSALFLISGASDRMTLVLPSAHDHPSGMISLRRVTRGRKVIARPNGKEQVDGGWVDKNQLVLDDDHASLMLMSDGTCWYLFGYVR